MEASLIRQPLLSIVVLVYNTADYLPACFDSLLQQRYRPIEIIAIDDASTDDSLAICRAYEAEYAEFRCITKANEGGAVSGNLGISMARGAYVALVDSDDLVTPDGYQLMMAQALATSADIVVGRAARLVNGRMSTTSLLYEPFVWSRARVLESVAEFPDLTEDGFYWNKVFRLDFLRQHGLGMVPGLLYADRPFVHCAYYLSRRTVILPALVYLWRSRDAATPVSITQNKAAAANFDDRVRSITIEWEQFADIAGADEYRRIIAVQNLHRALHVASGLVASPSLREVFLAGMQRLLALFGELDWHALGVRRALYLHLLGQADIDGFCRALALPMNGRVEQGADGRCYWVDPIEDDGLDLDHERLHVDFPSIGFFRIGQAYAEGEELVLELELHDAIMANCSVELALLSLEGNGGFAFVSSGRKHQHVHVFSLDLHNIDTRGERYALVLNYCHASRWGHYRIGRALIAEKVWDALPLDVPGGWNMAFDERLGGIGVRGAVE